MPRTYRQDCHHCGEYYEGRGEKYCSRGCAQEAQKANTEEGAPDLPTRPSERVEFEVTGDKATANAYALPRILTLQELLDHCEVDHRVWQVSRHRVNKWEAAIKGDDGRPEVVQLFQVKANLKRRPDAPLLRTLERALDKVADHAPSYPDHSPPIIRPKHERHLLEIVVPDLHIGKLAWHRETGEDYDSDIAAERFMDAIKSLLRRARTFGIDRWLLVVGNDLLHTDNFQQTTTAGTPQDVDSRHAKMVETACDLLVKGVDHLLGTAPGKVVGLPGNHDREEAISIARYLQAWYRNCEDVEVDAEPNPRKYHIYGKNLLGFCHGHEEKIRELPSIMAVERPELWSESRFREWHLGHYHKKKEYRPVYVDEHQGVRVRHLSSLTGTDAWHHRRGYVGNVKAAEGFMWNHQQGLQAIFNWNVPLAA